MEIAYYTRTKKFSCDISVNNIFFGNKLERTIFGSEPYLTVTSIVPAVANDAFVLSIYCEHSHYTKLAMVYPVSANSNNASDDAYGRILCDGSKRYGQNIQLHLTSHVLHSGKLVVLSFDGSGDIIDEVETNWIRLEGVPWDMERQLWIAHLKNDKNKECLLKQLSKNIIRVILFSFLGVNNSKSPFLQTKLGSSVSYWAPNVSKDEKVSPTNGGANEGTQEEKVSATNAANEGAANGGDASAIEQEKQEKQ